MAKIIEISDFSAPELDVYARLTENQLLNRADPKNAMFVAESPLVIGRAMDAGCVPLSFLMEPKHIEGRGHEILARCADDVPVYTAQLEVLTQLTGFHLTRGMLCAMRRPKAVCGSTVKWYAEMCCTPSDSTPSSDLFSESPPKPGMPKIRSAVMFPNPARCAAAVCHSSGRGIHPVQPLPLCLQL